MESAKAMYMEERKRTDLATIRRDERSEQIQLC